MPCWHGRRSHFPRCIDGQWQSLQQKEVSWSPIAPEEDGAPKGSSPKGSTLHRCGGGSITRASAMRLGPSADGSRGRMGRVPLVFSSFLMLCFYFTNGTGGGQRGRLMGYHADTRRLEPPKYLDYGVDVREGAFAWTTVLQFTLHPILLAEQPPHLMCHQARAQVTPPHYGCHQCIY
jgi:hypothetical protein